MNSVRTSSDGTARPAILLLAILVIAGGVIVWSETSTRRGPDASGPTTRDTLAHPTTQGANSVEPGRSLDSKPALVSRPAHSLADGALLQRLFRRESPAELARTLAALGTDGATACVRALKKYSGRDGEAIDLLIALAALGRESESVAADVLEWWRTSGAAISDRFVIRVLVAGGSPAAKVAAVDVARQAWDRWKAGSAEEREANSIFVTQVIDELADLAFPEPVDLLESIAVAAASTSRSESPAIGNAPAGVSKSWANSIGRAAWQARIASASGPAVDRIIGELERANSTNPGRVLLDILPVALREGKPAGLVKRIEPWVLSTLEKGAAADPAALAAACRLSFLYGESASNHVARILEEANREGTHGAEVVHALVEGTIDSWRRAPQLDTMFNARGLFDIVEKLTEREDPQARLRGSLVEALVKQGQEEDVERVIDGLERADTNGAAAILSKIPEKWFTGRAEELQALLDRMEAAGVSTPGAAAAARLAAERLLFHASGVARKEAIDRLKRSTFFAVSLDAKRHELQEELAALGAPATVPSTAPSTVYASVEPGLCRALFSHLRERAKTTVENTREKDMVCDAISEITRDRRFPIEPASEILSDPKVEWSIRLAILTGLAARPGEEACLAVEGVVSAHVQEASGKGPEFERDLWWVVTHFAARKEGCAPGVVKRAFLQREALPASADIDLDRAFDQVGVWLADSRTGDARERPASR